VTPAEVKALPENELPALAEKLRSRIIESVAANGGHLAASLGTVELTIGLLRVFSPPEDRILWDVGHQAYAWKMLTGRSGQFGRLRRHDGPSGFPNPDESPCDAFIAGHAGSALAAAVGIAAARDRTGGGSVVGVVGDASITNGESLEALNNCTALTKKMIVVVNDNAMSISRNVGAFARTIGRLLSDVRYNRAKAAAERAGHSMRLTFLRDAYHRAEQAIKSFWLANSLFESFGLRYVGPVDGHDLKAVISALSVAKDDKRSVVVHVVTKKGKGFAPAEADPAAWHGVGPFRVQSSEFRVQSSGIEDAPENANSKLQTPNSKLQTSTWSALFGEAMCEAARRDEKVCAVVAAMCHGTGLDGFAREFPDRFFDVGICEEMAVTFAAGLAKAGMKPVVAIYSTFLQRAIDQIQHDVCLQKLPVVFAVDRAGCVGEDGPTHHGLYDIALLRPLTGMRILAPCCADDLKAMLVDALAGGGPVAIRYPRGTCGTSGTCGTASNSKLQTLNSKHSTQVLILAVGDQVAKAADVKELLAKEGIAAEVVPVREVKPACPIERGGAQLVVSLENGVVVGGFGESVGADMRFGWPDAVVGHGTVAELEADFGFDAGSVSRAIAERMRQIDG
jgi:1-deoxy-D-xylulose-5-phosphate synthase